MKTLTETITQQLLDAVDDPAGLEAVLHRHTRSKGPLYHALAQATTEVQKRLSRTLGKVCEAESRERQLTDKVQALEQRCQELGTKEQALEQQICSSEARLLQTNELLDRADALAGLGFGPDELSRLHELLAQIAASQGAPPEEGASQFFQTVERYEHIVSLDLEAKRAEAKAAQAKAELERWEAEARRKESHSKARISTIDLVEKLLSQGVKEKDLPQWTNILEKAQVSVDALAKSLEAFGSMVGVCRQRDQQAEKLNEQVKAAEARLKALKRDETKTKAAIEATRDCALREVEKMSYQTQQHLAILLARAQQHGKLEKEAAQLEEYLTIARAFRSRDPKHWAEVPQSVVQQLLMGLTLWAVSGDHTRQVAVPEMVSRRVPAVRFCKLSLVDLLTWMLAGILTEEERKLLDSVA